MKRNLRLLIVICFCYLFVPVFNIQAKTEIDKYFPDIEGFMIVNGIKIYYPDNLNDAINGASEIYIDNEFRELAVAKYEKPENQIISIEIYRHENPDFAFGIYSHERYGNFFNYIDIGVQGYYETGTLNFYKDCYYVKIGAHNLKNEESVLMDVGRRIEEDLPGKNSFPEVFEEFPVVGLQVNQERLVAKNYLGYPFFNRVFTAEYRPPNTAFILCTYFLMQRDSRDECADILREYMKYLGKPDQEITEGKHIVDDPYYGIIELDWDNRTIRGFLGLEDPELRNFYLEFDPKDYVISKKDAGIAYGKPATSSSNENNNLLPEYAFDGELLTRWASAWRDSSWITVDLGRDYKINKVKLTWEQAYATSYKILVSLDNNNWTEVYSTQEGDGSIDEMNFDPLIARYVRMFGISRATPWGFSLYEFQVFKGKK
jgi:hypothetical protein